MENFEQNMKNIRSVLFALVVISLFWTYAFENVITRFDFIDSKTEETRK